MSAPRSVPLRQTLEGEGRRRLPRQRAKTIAAPRGWLPMRCRPTAWKPAEQAHVTALVGEIGADTATIARHLATLRTRIRFPYRGAEEGVILGILGDRLQPRRPAQLRATPLNRVDRVDILAGSAPISRGIAVSRRERG